MTMISSNEAISLNLGNRYSFHPAFSYHFFGEDEQVPAGEHLAIEFDLIFNKPFNVLEGATPYILESLKLSLIQNDNQNIYKTNDKVCASFDHKSTHYKIVKVDKASAFEVYHLGGIDLLTLFLIEGAQKIEEIEWASDRWCLYLLIQIAQKQFDKQEGLDEENITEKDVCCGFATAYRFPLLNDESAEACRLRLSQFVILPVWQRQGLGLAFYSCLYRKAFLPDFSVKEITVEDPNEAFSTMRLLSDHTQIVPFDEVIKLDVLSKKRPFKVTKADSTGNEESSLCERQKYKMSREAWERLHWLRAKNNTDEYRMAWKKAAAKKTDLPQDVEERKKILAEMFAREMSIFGSILAKHL